METQDALKKIEEINAIIQSSNKALFYGRHMCFYGALVLIVPIVGQLTDWLSFGYHFGERHWAYISIANTLFYWGLATLISRSIPRSRTYTQSRQILHPLIGKAFGVTRPILVSIFGVVVVLSLSGHGQFIYPIVFLLLGLMFSMYGKFSIPAVSFVAWTYIAAGLLHFHLLQFEIPYLSFYFLVYNGLSYILMGILLEKDEKLHVA